MMIKYEIKIVMKFEIIIEIKKKIQKMNKDQEIVVIKD